MPVVFRLSSAELNDRVSAVARTSHRDQTVAGVINTGETEAHTEVATVVVVDDNNA